MSPENTPTTDIGTWVERARHDPQRYPERQATEVLLAAIGASARYGDKLYLKGGILMGVVYGSPRQTADIDFTADVDPSETTITELENELNESLKRSAARLGYPGLVCRVQSTERKPRGNHFENARFPALRYNIAYAQRNSPEYKRLENGTCPRILKLEITFREPVEAVEIVRLGEQGSVTVYALEELIAEKLRALLQQVPRNRNRRQDIYDIAFLIREYRLHAEEKQTILNRLVRKARSREIEPTIDSLGDPEVRNRAKAEWKSLRLELGELPDFDETYDKVEAFYRSLPWQ